MSTIRVGIARRYFFDDLEPAVGHAVEREIETLRARGVIVLDVDLPVDLETMGIVFEPIVAFEIWSRFGADWRATPSAFSKSFAAFFMNERPAIAAYEAALAALKAYQAQVDRVFDRVDVILTPTVPVVAPPIAGPIDGARILRNTWPFNAAGTPAISIPCRRGGSSDPPELPVGLQLIARRGDDDKLLRIAKTFEGLRA